MNRLQVVRTTAKWTVAVMTAAMVAACGGTVKPATPLERGKGGGDTTCDATAYPCGPYGYQKGSIIANLSLVGRKHSSNIVDTTDPVTTIQLSDYFQDKNIEALVVSATAQWCQPCQEEQSQIENMYKQWYSDGAHVAIVEASVQKTNGDTADISTADTWAGQFGVTFQMVVDPTEVLGPYYDINAFPMNMVIRTSDMSIVWQANGLDPDGVKTQVEAILANP